MAAEKQSLISALNTLAGGLEKQVADSKKNYNSASINEFLCGDSKSSGVYGLYPVQLYYHCLTACGVKTREELEDLWKRLYRDEEVRESVEGLLSAEDSWRAFISVIDADLQKLENELSPPSLSTLGSPLPQGLSLVDATSGNTVAINTLLKQSLFTLFIFRKHYV